MSWNPNTDTTTADLYAGFTGLWATSRKMCMQSLAWALLRDLEEQGVRTNEVEKEALKRSWNREVKKGFSGSMEEYEKSEIFRRDEKYVSGLLNLRAGQAKEDWATARTFYKKQKAEVMRKAKEENCLNWAKSEMKRLVKHYKEVYTDLRSGHLDKVENLVKKHRKSTVRKDKIGRSKWIQRMAKGSGKERTFTNKVPIYGNITLDDDELSVLNLPPKLCTLPKITTEGAEYEGVLCNVKLRWSRRQTGSLEEQELALEEQDKEKPEPEEQTMKREVEENSCREVYNGDTKTLDFRRLRATDMDNNPRVGLPPPRPDKEEDVLGAKELIWSDITMSFIKKNCREDGNQKVDNLTKQQRRGIGKLKARAERGELVITCTDKSGKLAVSSRENYTLSGRPHTTNDRPVSWKEVGEAKKVIQGHNKALGNVFRMGENWGQKGEQRVRSTMNENVTVIPKMSNLVKDHKAPISMEDQMVPATRPVCNASVTMNQRVSNTLTETLGALFKAENETCEAVSTEDMIHQVDVLNSKIRSQKLNPKDLMVGSLDVTALYPSIDTDQAADICRDKVLESDMVFDGIDYRWALVYLALTCTNRDKVDNNLQDVIPRRLRKQGSRPTVLTAEVDEKREHWWYPVTPGK